MVVFNDKSERTRKTNEIFWLIRNLAGSRIDAYDNCGAVQIRLPDRPFLVNSYQRSANIGKIFIVRLFEAMYTSGYDFMFSSDLSRLKDQSTLFFRKSLSGLSGRRAKKIICIAPGLKLQIETTVDEYKSEKLAHFLCDKLFIQS